MSLLGEPSMSALTPEQQRRVQAYRHARTLCPAGTGEQVVRRLARWFLGTSDASAAASGLPPKLATFDAHSPAWQNYARAMFRAAKIDPRERKTLAIKEVREYTHLGLKESKDLVEATIAPKVDR